MMVHVVCKTFIFHVIYKKKQWILASLTCIRIESKHEVTILGGLNEFIVKFHGPQGSKWHGGIIIISGDTIIITFNRQLLKGLRNKLSRTCRLYITLLYILISTIITLYHNIKCECVKISPACIFKWFHCSLYQTDLRKYVGFCCPPCFENFPVPLLCVWGRKTYFKLCYPFFKERCN